jgi:hypothetical protein
MRRRDKLKNIEKINKRLNENRFSWDGTYANEVNEDEVAESEVVESAEEDVEAYNHLYDVEASSKDDDVVDPYTLREKKMMALGNDMEMVDEECGCPLDQPEPSDVEKSQWFSQEDGERLTDKVFN